ncbi:hypothetical protein [Calothrix sp. NIES-2098]
MASITIFGRFWELYDHEKKEIFSTLRSPIAGVYTIAKYKTGIRP